VRRLERRTLLRHPTIPFEQGTARDVRGRRFLQLTVHHLDSLRASTALRFVLLVLVQGHLSSHTGRLVGPSSSRHGQAVFTVLLVGTDGAVAKILHVITPARAGSTFPRFRRIQIFNTFPHVILPVRAAASFPRFFIIQIIGVLRKFQDFQKFTKFTKIHKNSQCSQPSSPAAATTGVSVVPVVFVSSSPRGSSTALPRACVAKPAHLRICCVFATVLCSRPLGITPPFADPPTGAVPRMRARPAVHLAAARARGRRPRRDAPGRCKAPHHIHAMHHPSQPADRKYI
jgi:hypothetical protein